jgi:hypothetical protein
MRVLVFFPGYNLDVTSTANLVPVDKSLLVELSEQVIHSLVAYIPERHRERMDTLRAVFEPALSVGQHPERDK